MADWRKVRRVGLACAPWVTMVAAALVPIAVAVLGVWIQATIADQDVQTRMEIANREARTQEAIAERALRKDYMALALGILAADPKTQAPEARKWAVATLQENMKTDKQLPRSVTDFLLQHRLPQDARFEFVPYDLQDDAKPPLDP